MSDNSDNNVLTIDVEDWFHILDSPVAPEISQWPELSLRASFGMEKILQLLSETDTKATFILEHHPVHHGTDQAGEENHKGIQHTL